MARQGTFIKWPQFKKLWRKVTDEMGYHASIYITDDGDVEFWHPVELGESECSTWYVLRSDGVIEDYTKGRKKRNA